LPGVQRARAIRTGPGRGGGISAGCEPIFPAGKGKLLFFVDGSAVIPWSEGFGIPTHPTSDTLDQLAALTDHGAAAASDGALPRPG
jgi:hypothetical protein